VYSWNEWLSIAAKKTTTYSHSHQLQLHNSKYSDQYLHTYWRLWGHILLFYGAQYGHYWYSQTSDFQEALRKVIICPDRYLLTNTKTRCSLFAKLTCTSGNRALVNCQNSTFLKYLPKSKVLKLIGIYYLCRTVPVSVQNVTHSFWYVCTRANSTEWRNPKYLTPTSGWGHCCYHQEIDSRPRKGSQ